MARSTPADYREFIRLSVDLPLNPKLAYSQGGPDDLDNLQTLCGSRDGTKGARV